ncbi:hypothetical protein HG530_009323 [Fusarium avenaceum]|nr:hypothetical protein HG530_009323 [Fusarium avenaceum]
MDTPKQFVVHAAEKWEQFVQRRPWFCSSSGFENNEPDNRDDGLPADRLWRSSTEVPGHATTTAVETSLALSSSGRGRNGSRSRRNRLRDGSVATADLDSGNLLSGVLGSDHDDGLGVAGGKIRVDGGIDDEKVVSTVDFCVEVDNAAAVALAAIVNTHLGAAHPVVSADHLGGEDIVHSGTRCDVRQGGVASADQVEPVLDKVAHGLAILLVDQPGLGLENGVSTRGNAELTNGCGTVGQETADSDDAVGHGAGSTLEVAIATVGALGRGPEVHSLGSLGDRTRALVVKVQVSLNRLGGNVVELVGSEVAVALELEHDLGVVLEMVTDGKVNEVGSRGKSDTSLGSTLLNDSKSISLSDTSVPEKTRSRHGTSSEDDLAAGLDLDNLLATVGSLGEDTGDLAAGSNGLDDLCLELEGEVGEVLGKGHTISSLGDIGPAPALRPAGEVALRRVDEVKTVDGAGSSKETASSGSSVTAELGGSHATQAAAEGGDIIGSQGVVPGEALGGVSESDCVGWAALDEKNADAGLGKTLSGDDTSGTTTDDDDISSLGVSRGIDGDSGPGVSNDRRLSSETGNLLSNTALAQESVRGVGTVDPGTLGDRGGLDGSVGVHVRVGVGAGNAEAGDDVITVRPSDEEKTANHATAERNTTPTLLLVVREDHLSNQVLAEGLRDSNTEGEAIVVELLEVNTRLGVGVSRRSNALSGG